tara:strand:- start:16135 stop:17088 length:954 start_codon:yes stop_codon:yes gene_type:complete
MSKIICTLGPKSLNKEFLKFSTKNIDLLRLNMSHIDTNDLEKKINFIRKYTKTQICIDTEGAQIRTKCKVSKKFKLNETIKLNKFSKSFQLYPNYIFNKLKKNDILEIGFENLKVKVTKSEKFFKILKVIMPGKLENNKGVHLVNRKISINYLTEKDFEAIEIGKKLKIKFFALSFTNSVNDIEKFNKILPKYNKIFKIETKNAIKDFKNMLKVGNYFLIDRGDLSKDIKIENIPIVQRYLASLCKKNRKNLFIATNLLESMVVNLTPTRGEANDIYSILEMGAKGLVLAAETAIGNYPIDCVNFLKKMVKIYKKKH